VTAAGRGERLRGPDNKGFVEIAGKPLAAYSLDVFRSCDDIEDIILVVAPEDVERARRCLLRADGARSERVVAGGDHRQASVAAALAEVSPAAELIVVHDAARPFVTVELIRRCLEAAAEHGAAIAAVPSTDTVKEAQKNGFVGATLDRSKIWLVQTPQVFRRKVLQNAHDRAARDGYIETDDAALVEQSGHRVYLVQGDLDNMKITYPTDVRRAKQALGERRMSMSREAPVRSGIGYDAHRFAVERPLLLGGVRVRDDQGLSGHSDADVLCHAVCDALLGALGIGDIGTHFPDSDPALTGISSLALLERVAGMICAAGWKIENVDTTVVAEQPRIAEHVPAMRRAMATAMGIDASQVNVKGKTTEGMGFTGRGEGIASFAVATLRPIENTRAGAHPRE